MKAYSPGFGLEHLITGRRFLVLVGLGKSIEVRNFCART